MEESHFEVAILETCGIIYFHNVSVHGTELDAISTLIDWNGYLADGDIVSIIEV